MLLGKANVNRATFSLGRDKKNGKALALLGVDEAISDNVIEKIKKLPLQLLDTFFLFQLDQYQKQVPCLA